MGLLYSVFCTITFCVERVLTWALCSCAIIMLLFGIILLMVYGVTVGYSYAQKELAAFASASREMYSSQLSRMPAPPSTPMRRRRRSGGDNSVTDQAIIKNQIAMDRPTKPMFKAFRNRNAGERTALQQKPSPLLILPTERPPAAPEMQPHEKELARQLIGRFRRSKHITTKDQFLRPVTDNPASLPVAG